MPFTAVLNRIGLSVRGLKDRQSFFDEKLLQLTDLEHFAHDVASADEFSLDVELRDRGPVGEDLDAIPQFGRVVHIERPVRDPDVFENLDQLTRKSALWKLRRAFMKSTMSFDLTSFSMNCSMLMISSHPSTSGPQRPL